MLSVFFERAEDGSYYSMTQAGYVALGVLTLLTVLSIAMLRKRPEKRFSAKEMAFSAMAVAIAFVLSFIKIIQMPWGGAVTLCSMLFVVLIGNWYGARVGLVAGLAYGLLQFMQDGGSYMLNPLQVCLDYILAFMALGTSGFLAKKKNGLIKGYLFAILLRGAFHSLGGYLYWMEYMPEDFPEKLALAYPIFYNYAYILAEGAITVLLLLLPPVRKAVERIGRMAAD
ncbi:MAG: energy-coupled thiamine transporter ThiT [Lachnospiraceae bacterium]|nr:energy-coupled thiamine transporter ThiT [Lachnospiraceae bacterium]